MIDLRRNTTKDKNHTDRIHINISQTIDILPLFCYTMCEVVRQLNEVLEFCFSNKTDIFDKKNMTDMQDFLHDRHE